MERLLVCMMPTLALMVACGEIDGSERSATPRSSFSPCTVVWYSGPQYKPLELRVNETSEVVAKNIEAGVAPGAKFLHLGGDAYLARHRTIYGLERC